MMNQIVYWEIVGFIFVVIFGTLLHFVYQWSGNNKIVGILAPVNESTWEHLKLLFVPMVLYSIVEYCFIGNLYPNYIVGKALGIAIGMLAIIAIFYTYTGVAGNHYLWADILTFVLGVAIAYLYSWKTINKPPLGSNVKILGILLIILLALCFVACTFDPPRIPLYMDPVTKKYGISADRIEDR